MTVERNWRSPGPPQLEPRLQAILGQSLPRFSAAEFDRRRAAVEEAMEAAGAKHLIAYGFLRVGPMVGWLTGWPTSTEAAVIVTPGERLKLYVQHFNHVPQAQKIAINADVEWGGVKTIPTVIEELKRLGVTDGGVALMGAPPLSRVRELEAGLGPLIDMDGVYNRFRIVKSPEELDWMRIAAELSDLGILALEENLRPGLTEHEMGDIVESGYLRYGGTTMIHFFGVTPMADPDLCVPPQITAVRKVAAGDVVFTEITAIFWEYSGQILRTYTVAADPTPLYAELHEVAEAAYDAVTGVLKAGATPADVIEAAAVIEDAGFSVWDDLVHGFGGGYLQPVLGSKSRPAGPVPDFTYEAGMCFVVQPNVITTDFKAGVQTGGLVVVTEDGVEPLHRTPRGMRRIDPSRLLKKSPFSCF